MRAGRAMPQAPIRQAKHSRQEDRGPVTARKWWSLSDVRLRTQGALSEVEHIPTGLWGSGISDICGPPRTRTRMRKEPQDKCHESAPHPAPHPSRLSTTRL